MVLSRRKDQLLMYLNVENMTDINEDLVHKLFDKKSPISGGAIKSKTVSNQALEGQLHEPIIRKFEKCELYSSLTKNILGGGLLDVQLIDKYNKGIRFLICFVDIFSKYAWVAALKDNKVLQLLMNFNFVFLDEPSCKSTKIWVGKGSQL